MKVDVVLYNLPAGYALESHRKNDPTPIKVETIGFYTSADGEKFMIALEGISDYLKFLPENKKISEPQIQTFLAIISRNKSCTLYINEINIVAGIICKNKAQL